ncbi:receptor-like serine/threonine-protein kinase At1g78530 [Glycine max]|uniref:receptor-like serine/threonine-protein kinase At1g78530 n=1 Tax=Glycine max TaxID=3847 RepID=UPI0003DEA53B|nr:receptor-like serine/threonine-protein kinase At1g78530 [Glycine max]|eukprot:XP_006580801.1 receptor-like serine/threonine-protein kinase At1g78530 [Glycine max]
MLPQELANDLCRQDWKKANTACTGSLRIVRFTFLVGSFGCFNGCGKSTLLKTQKLNSKDIIGSGGYGVVYELKLDDSTTLAIKRLNRRTAERDKGFERELEAMANIKHHNIVTLHGYYTAPHYNLLIYELMHGMASKHILKELKDLQKDPPTSWR